jgi:hypothetical protein
VRITGQLIEAETGRHVWADRFDGDLSDIFELQDRITEKCSRVYRAHTAISRRLLGLRPNPPRASTHTTSHFVP